MMEKGEGWWARAVGMVGDQYLAANMNYGPQRDDDPESIAEPSLALATHFLIDLAEERTT